MTTDQPEHEQPDTPRTDSVNQTQDTSKQKLLVCANEYLQMLHHAPELTFFIKNYIHQHQDEILAVDFTVKGATMQLRRLLADLVHDTLDAVMADVNVAVKAEQPKMVADDPYTDGADGEGMMGDDNATAQQKELAMRVSEELGTLVFVAKTAVDDELLGTQAR